MILPNFYRNFLAALHIIHKHACYSSKLPKAYSAQLLEAIGLMPYTKLLFLTVTMMFSTVMHETHCTLPFGLAACAKQPRAD